MSERPDLEEIIARHQSGGWDLCTECMDKEGENSLPWPCDAFQAASYAARLEREAEALRPVAEPRCHPHRYATSATSRWYRDQDGREVEVRMNPPELDASTVDEIVTDEIHLEQMDFNHYWMRINGVSFWLHARGKITLTHEPDTAREIVVPLEETCEGNGCGIFGAAEREGGGGA